MDLKPYQWGRLSKQQAGAYTEYFVKMELTMYGFQVYTSEVDDRGIDFVARHDQGPFIQVQVKSLRSLGYVFMRKSKLALHENTFIAFGFLVEGRPPLLYLIPSTVWRSPNATFVSRDYEGKESDPEWGINVSKRNLPSLQPFLFATTLGEISIKNRIKLPSLSTLLRFTNCEPEGTMPKQEIFFEQQIGDTTVEVLKSYDQGFANEAFRNMSETAQQHLWNSLKPEEVYDTADLPRVGDPGGEAEAFLWDELLESAREDGNLRSFFIVNETTSEHTESLYVSPDWPSAEGFVKTFLTNKSSAA